MGKAIKFWTQVIHLWTPESPSASECMMSQIFHNRAINLHLILSTYIKHSIKYRLNLFFLILNNNEEKIIYKKFKSFNVLFTMTTSLNDLQ